MATTNKDDKPEKLPVNEKDQESLLQDCQEAEESSYRWLSTMRGTWDDKESMLLGTKPEDKLSKKTNAKVFVPALSTMIIERSSRVMAQPPVGRAFAVSKDDVGKNLLMNLLLNYFPNHATEEGSFVLKLRQLNVYSHVFGSFFGLVPWRVNKLKGYIGPEFLPIGMRDVRPQPGRRTVDKMDRFGVRSVVSLNWLKNQDKTVWMNIDKIETEMKAAKDGGESARSNDKDTKSYVERERFPSPVGDGGFPDIEIFTDYQYDKWVTWAPRFKDIDSSHPHILRVVKNPYPKGYLPIVAKHAFPLIDSPIGLGDFERGKTLQFATNSLVNLYLDGVKYAIFPPLHINLDEVDPSSILWGAGNKWYMQKPNQSVQPMNMNSTQWLSTFQETYGFLSSAIQNLSGSTNVAQTQGVEPGLGRTPEAVKQYGLSQSARDEWDRFMMEDTIQQIYNRWIALITTKLDVPMTMRIFGSEVKDLQKTYPEEDILEMFESGTRGNVKIDKNLLNDEADGEPTQYDFELESGSTVAKNNMDEGEAASQVIKDFIDAPELLKYIQQRGKDIDFAELYKRRLIGSSVKDWDKILIDAEDMLTNPDALDADGNVVNAQSVNGLEQLYNMQAQQAGGQQQPVDPNAAPPVAPVQQVPPAQPAVQQTVPAPAAPAPTGNGVKDPDIAAVIANATGGQA